MSSGSYKPLSEFEEYTTTQELVLSRRRFALQWSQTADMRYQLYPSLAYKRHELSVYIWGREAKQIVKFEPVSYPADWWQAFRARFFPAWWLKRWPLQLTVVKREPVVVVAEALFPEIPPDAQRGDRLAVRFYTNPPVEFEP